MSAVTTAHRDRFVLDRLPPPEARAEKIRTLPAGTIPERVNAAAALIEAHSRERPHAPACRAPNGEWSYAELARAVDRIAAVLVEEHGVLAGNRVLLRGPNSPMLLAGILAVLKAGGIAVPTVPALRENELTAAIAAARPDLALCDQEVLSPLDRVCAETGEAPPIIGFGAESAPLERAMAAKTPGAAAVDTAREDPALILLSSGTTGAPKAAVHTHGDLLAVAESFGRHVFRAEPGDVVTGSPSLAFAYGFGFLLICPLAAGAAVYLSRARGTPALIEALAVSGASLLATAPTAYRKLLAEDRPLASASLRRCFSAGEHLPEAVIEQWRARTGLPILDVLGSTEMLGPYVAAREDARRAGCIGKAVPGYSLSLLEAGPRASGGERSGRLAVRGPTGCWYLDSRDQAGAVRAGWTLTGDFCRIDADGYVAYEGRADDLIITAGYTVAVPEIEAELARHPAVLECAVTGLPDEERGCIVAALVVPGEDRRDSGALAEELIAHVKSRLAAYKAPRRVAVVGELPRTASGKIRRGALASLFDKDIQ